MSSANQSLANELDGGECQPVLACEAIHRRLGEGAAVVHALRGVSLELIAGKTYAIVGPSGCGKSTLLYSLGLLDQVDEGIVRIGGEDASRMSDSERTDLRLARIGFVFQFHFLLAEFSALENVMLPMIRLGRWSRAEMRKRGELLLERVGLGSKRDRRANRLSGGEQQRVAVARALANAPSIVLADEPTGNLDETNADRVIELLTDVAREEDCAVAIVTHNPAIAERCDVELRMSDGRLLEG